MAVEAKSFWPNDYGLYNMASLFLVKMTWMKKLLIINLGAMKSLRSM
jgi:hypothetical protein